MAKLSALQHLGLAYETTYGTGIAPTFFFPLNSVKHEDSIKKINDEGRRANLSKVFAVYDSVTSSTLDLELMVYPDAIGYLLKMILGQDTPTGTSPNYTHPFKLVNTLAPSATLSYYNGLAQHQIAGAIMSELSFKVDTESALTASAKFVGQKSTQITTVTPTFTTVNPFMGWQSSLTIGGTNNTNLVGAQINLKREAKLLYGANNSQTPNQYSTGRLDVTGKLTFDVNDEAELALLGTTPDKAIVLTLTQDANTSLAFQFTLPDITKANADTSQEFVRVDLDFTAQYNTTDAGPCLITLKNQVASY